MRLALLILLALAASTACGTDTQAGNAVAAMPPRPAAATSGTPREPARTLDLTGEDPCKALTAGQIRKQDYDLGYRRPPLPGTDPIDHGPTCDFTSTKRAIGVTIIYSLHNGVEAWRNPPRARGNPWASIKEGISGYPALTATNTDTPDECSVFVDNHDGQYVEVFATPDMDRTTTDSQFYCGEAKTVAGMVMTTLASGR